MATIVQRPIKAIVQGDGDVVLGEFTDQDGKIEIEKKISSFGFKSLSE